MEEILHQGVRVAIRVRAFKSGTHGLTAQNDALQLLTQRRSKGHVVLPHRHLPKRRTTALLQEGLIVIKGRIRVDLYDKAGKCFRRFFVKAGESAVLLGVAHAVHFLEDSLVYECKNGPFIQDKIFL